MCVICVARKCRIPPVPFPPVKKRPSPRLLAFSPLRLLAFSPLRLLAFVSVCLRLFAFARICLRPPLLRPLCVTLISNHTIRIARPKTIRVVVKALLFVTFKIGSNRAIR